MRGKRYFLYMINTLLKPLESYVSRQYDYTGKNSSPVFVIGSPRSGSTFLSQLILNRFEFSYISNFRRELYACPILAGKLERRLYGEPVRPFPYNSYYGLMNGPLSPHEGGNFWFQWLPSKGEVFVKESSISEYAICQIRENVSKIEVFYDAPFFSKNLYLSMWIGPLVKAFPNASFIVSFRDVISTSKSLLKGRKDVYGNPKKWLGVSPPGYRKIQKKNYYRQVVEQAHFIYTQIEKDIEKYGKERFLKIPYEQLCEKPGLWLNKIDKFFEKRGHTVKRLEVGSDLPISKPKNNNDSCSDTVRLRYEYEKLLSEL